MAYRFPEYANMNYENFYKIRKDLVTTYLWRGLPLSTKSIYPVIGCFANKSGVSYPSQQTIADLCGCTRKTVYEGINGLLKIPWVELQNKITSRGNRQKLYKITHVDEQTKYFSFYKEMLETGIWRQLSTEYHSKAAHGIYVTCMAYAAFDFDLYCEIEEDLEYDVNEFWNATDGYNCRKYDFLSADLDVISYSTGVSLPTAKKAIQALIDVTLLEEIPNMETQIFKIRRSPSIYFKRDYLNECLQRTQPAPTDFMKCGGLGVYEEPNSNENQVKKILPTK